MTNRKETTILTDQTRWSLGRGKPLVPSRWQATGDGGHASPVYDVGVRGRDARKKERRQRYQRGQDSPPGKTSASIRVIVVDFGSAVHMTYLVSLQPDSLGWVINRSG